MTSLPSEAREEIANFLDSRTPQKMTPGKRRIMQAVLTAFVRDGDAGLSMRAIATESALKPASIYSHFPGGKDELVCKTVFASYVDFLALVIANTDSKGSAQDQFEHLAAAHFDFQRTNGFVRPGDVNLHADHAPSQLTEAIQQSVNNLRELYRNYIVALITQMSGGLDASSKAEIVVNILDSTAPRSLVMKAFPEQPLLKDLVIGACLGVIHSERVEAPSTTVPASDAMDTFGGTRVGY
jgi:AcrR family transcriptional regulator|nr:MULTISPECIES: TetR/AcrR family transcriptional regulator [unclassified Arthrobacter]AFK89597.1 Transcriptional regulator, TetR family [Arthrobacter sp. J3.53]